MLSIALELVTLSTLPAAPINFRKLESYFRSDSVNVVHKLNADTHEIITVTYSYGDGSKVDLHATGKHEVKH